MESRTEKIITLLEDINKVPRKSGNRRPIHNYFRKWAEDNNFSYKADDALNLNISVPGTKGYENSPGIVLQGHMDMVCEKTADSDHDFSKDPIVHVIKGDWLSAKDTSLGADNGIALAVAMLIAVDSEVRHPPLELLFTTDEEVGLSGVNELSPEFVKGKILLNLDSEETGIFTIGCAGSTRTHLNFKFEQSPVPENTIACTLRIGGLLGGHSAGDINKERANAIAVLVRGLSTLYREVPFHLSMIDGGASFNSIPRSAHAVIVVEKKYGEKVEKLWETYSGVIISENSTVEKNVFLKYEKVPLPERAVSQEETERILENLRIFPNGVQHMDAESPEQIETSLNMGMIRMGTSSIMLSTMQRSSVKSRLEELTGRIEILARLFRAEYILDIFLDPWQPDRESLLMKRCGDIWKKLYGEVVKTEVTHGGLECGIIGNICGGMDMISFGPDIENPHSPDERLRISSVEKIFNFLTELLSSYK